MFASSDLLMFLILYPLRHISEMASEFNGKITITVFTIDHTFISFIGLLTRNLNFFIF